MVILSKGSLKGRGKKVPIGVVSKNDVGDRKTDLSAALKRFRLATKLAILRNVDKSTKH
jgi:hypothetical protein